MLTSDEYAARNVSQVPVVEQVVPAGAPFVRPVDALQPRGPIANAIEQHAGSVQVHEEGSEAGRAADAVLDQRVNGGHDS